MTALHWATYQDDLEIAELLVRAGANVKAANRYGVTPLSLACTNGNGAMVELLLEGRRGPERAPSRRRNAVDDGRADRRARLREGAAVARGASVDSKDDRRGQTALMWAAAEGHADVVQALIDAGADFRTRVPSGFTPLLFAVREGRIDVVRVLLKAGADVNETIPADGTQARLWRPAAAGGRQRAAPGGDERAFRAGGASAGRRRQSECRPAGLHGPPRDHGGPQAGRRRQRSRSRGIRKHEQHRAREEARGAWREREREDDEEGEPEQHAAERDRGDAVPPGRADRGRRVDEDAGRAGRRSASAERREQHAADGGGRTRHALPRRGRRNRE